MLRRLLMVGTPVAFAVLTVFHPISDPNDPDLAVGRWFAVHGLQVVLTVLLAYCLWFMFEGLTSRAATVARAALPVFLVFFSVFDAVAGLATAWLARTAEGQSGAEQAATLRAIEDLFQDNWLTGNLSIASSVTALSWATIAIAGAVALRRGGADRITVGFMAASIMFAQHPAPFGTLGLLALAVAAYLWSRPRTATDGAAAATGTAGGPIAVPGARPGAHDDADPSTTAPEPTEGRG